MKQQILVIDDEGPIRELLTAYFEKHGFGVQTAGTGAEAIQCVEESAPDVVILDINLGDTDGLDVLSDLKKLKPSIPVILMSGIGYDEQIFQEAKDRGACAILSKTVPLEELLIEVKKRAVQR